MYLPALPSLTAALLLAGLTTLGACTLGGGSSNGNTGGGNTNTGGTGTIDEEQNTGNTVGGGSSSTETISVSGVAATGAPLLGARIRVIDALGRSINLVNAAGSEISSDSSSTADGSFRITLAKTVKPVLPLILQARGQDAGGRPVVLHSLVPASNTGTANITPLTDATLAQLLGASPATALQTPNLLTLLNSTSAVANASSQIRNILKANLTATKVSASVDLFQAPFTSNKTGQDLLLEGIRIGIIQDSSGKEVLQIGNKFVRGAEVSVDLATARSELVKTSGGDVSKAITSTLKATTSPTLTNLETLDQIGSSINTLIAQNGSASSYSTAPVLATYTRHNGRTLAQLADRLVYFASRGYQLSNFQLTGCAEDPIPTKGCSNFGVAALVTDNQGNQVETFTDVATYSTANKRWELIGNGLEAAVAVYPAAYTSLDRTGSLIAATTAAPNPVVGIEVAVGAATDAVPPANSTATVNSATVTIPSGYGIPLYYCGQKTLCVTGVPASTATGTPVDSLLLQTAKGWIGISKDGAAGAQYQFSITPFASATFSTSAYLPASVSSAPSSRYFPQLDDITADTPLSAAQVSAGTRLSWRKWASANPDLQVFLVKTLAISSNSSSSFELAEIRIPDPVAVPSINVGSTSVTTVALASSNAARYEVWLGAQDTQGRRYYSKYLLTQ